MGDRLDPNKAINIRRWSICESGRVEMFYYVYIHIPIYILIFTKNARLGICFPGLSVEHTILYTNAYYIIYIHIYIQIYKCMYIHIYTNI